MKQVKALYIFLAILFLYPMLCTAQQEWGGLKGIITYRSDNSALHADAGAEVIVYYIDSVKGVDSIYRAHRIEDSIINSSCLATIYYDIWEHTPIKRSQKEMIRKLRKLNAYPKDKLDELDRMAAAIVRRRERFPLAKAVADNHGNYYIKLRPGYYGVIVRSAHLHGHTETERNGNILLDIVEIKKGQIIARNHEML